MRRSSALRQPLWTTRAAPPTSSSEKEATSCCRKSINRPSCCKTERTNRPEAWAFSGAMALDASGALAGGRSGTDLLRMSLTFLASAASPSTLSASPSRAKKPGFSSSPISRAQSAMNAKVRKERVGFDHADERTACFLSQKDKFAVQDELFALAFRAHLPRLATRWFRQRN